MIKQILFSLVIVFGLMSCEEPVHEEYEMDGAIHDWGDDSDSDGGDDGDASGVYVPLTIGNKWVQEKVTPDGTFIETSEIVGTVEFDGDTYFEIANETTSDVELGASYIKKDGDTYVSRTEVEMEVGGITMASDPFFTHPLKDNISIGDSWSEEVVIVYHIEGFPDPIEISTNYTYEVDNIYSTYESYGTTYDDVLKLIVTMVAEEYPEVVMDSYFALNIGSIESSSSEGSSHLLEYNIE